MKERVKFMLEYGGWPLWLTQDGVVGEWTDLPEEWAGESDLRKDLDQLQDIFNGLYIDTEKVFDFHGFHSREEERKFVGLVETVRKKIRRLLKPGDVFADHVTTNFSDLEPEDKSDSFYRTE